jgi:membrane protein required for colicin V production
MFSRSSILLVVACGLIVLGMVKGLVRILIGLAALVAAFAVAARFHQPLSQKLGFVDIGTEPLMLVSYVLIFIGVMLAGGLVAYLLRRLLKAAMLSWADRMAGAAVGLVVAFLGAALVVLPMVAYSPWGGSVLRDSLLAPYVAAGADLAVSIAPEPLSERYERHMQDLKRVWRGEFAEIPRDSV